MGFRDVGQGCGAVRHRGMGTVRLKSGAVVHRCEAVGHRCEAVGHECGFSYEIGV